MAPATLSLLVFLALTVWRFVFAGFCHRRWVREIEAPQQRRNGFLEPRLHIFDRADVGVLAGNLENGSDGPGRVARQYRAQSYLRRVVALTGAKQMGSGYVLDVGTTRFEGGIDMSGGCGTWPIPNVHTRKPAFIPHKKKCRKRSKLLRRCCSSRTIQRCLTSGSFRAAWRLRPTARCSTVRSVGIRDENATQIHAS